MSHAKPNVAVLFYRVGPYHFARLRAAGQQMHVTALECSNVDPFYMWDEVAGQEGFERVTLFNGVPVEQQSAEMIATRMRAVLSAPSINTPSSFLTARRLSFSRRIAA